MLPRIDLHVHSNFSDSNATILDIVRVAEKKGLEMVGISDHHNDLPPKKFNRYIKVIERWDQNSDVSVMKGIEIDVGPDGVESLVDERSLNKLDYVIASIHDSGLDRNKTKKFDALKFAIKSDVVDVIGHPNIGFSEDLMVELANIAKDYGTAFEINSSYKVPRDQFLRICLNNSVKLSIGSDSHSLESVGNIKWCINALERNNVELNDLFFPEG